MSVVVYGGSFNPPHLGHAAAAMTVSRCAAPDLFLIIPDNVPPHKDMEPGSPDAKARLSLCELAFREVPNAVVSDLELRREGKSYTADTVDALRRDHPEDELMLVMGTDMLLSFEEWYRFEHLLQSCTLLVLAREEDEDPALEKQADYLTARYGARIRLLPHEPLPMASSDIRQRLKLRQGRELLDGEVYAAIIRNAYYDALPELGWLRQEAYSWLDEKRIAHVAGCESEAVLLARHWGVDPEEAATAGMLHDITKKFGLEDQLNFCEKYGIIVDNAMRERPQLLHAKTGAALARDLYGVSEEIGEAIAWHTTGKPDMSLLEKLVYLADIIEPGRDYPSVEKLRALSYQDLDEAMALALERSLEDLRRRGVEPYKDTVDAFQWYSQR